VGTISIYTHLLNALNTISDSPEVERLLADLDSPGNLTKVGGYRARLVAKKSGVQLSFAWHNKSWALNSAFLFASGIDRYVAFPDLIEDRVPMSATRNEVRAILGKPSWYSGGGAPVAQTIIDYPWDRFDFSAHSTRFDYEQENGAVRMVSVMTRDLMLELNADRV
jgi:hypothetical protein